MLFAVERRWLTILAVVVALMLIVSSTTWLWSKRDAISASRDMVREHHLNHTAFSPSGTPSRHPEGLHRGVDLKYSPHVYRGMR